MMISPEVPSARDGILVPAPVKWEDFATAVGSLDPTRLYVFRGQKDAEWPLVSPLDRDQSPALREPGFDHLRHRAEFENACRGRRGFNPPPIYGEAWWALGRHYGMKTPLLDWTFAPYVALYFAFWEQSDSSHRAVYALNKSAVEDKCKKMRNVDGRSVVMEFPEFDNLEDPRMIAQRGLFTCLRGGDDIESWLVKAFRGSSERVLVKFRIENAGREACLRELGRMNITHLTLFPDLTGAALYMNLKLEIPRY